MKKIYIIFVIVIVTLAAVNVDISLKSEKSAKIRWTDVLALSNDENPPPVNRIRFSYDASGNMTGREFIAPTPPKSPQNDDDTENSIADNAGSSMLKSAWSGSGNTGASVTDFPVLNDFISEIKINVYPNPTRGKVQVDIEGIKIPANASIYIYNAMGAKLRQMSGISTTNELDISEQPAGLYVVRVILGQDNVQVFKIIKE